MIQLVVEGLFCVEMGMINKVWSFEMEVDIDELKCGHRWLLYFFFSQNHPYMIQTFKGNC